MTITLFHLALASLSLLALAVASAFLLARWRTRVEANYRLVVGVLGAILVLAAAQVALERSGLELAAPSAARVLRAQSPAPAVEPTPSPAAPEFLLVELALERALPAAEPAPLGVAPGTRAPASPARLPAPGEILARTSALLVPLWAVGAGFFLQRTLRRLLAARRLLARGRSALDGELAHAWRETARAWPAARGVELLVSADVETPVCFGLFRRVILVPVHAQRTLEPASLAQVLLHELIHLERRDAWAMALAELVRALFWFHPAAWYLCREADELRELSCDALVVRRSGRPGSYARGLVACAERMRGVRALPFAGALPSWSGSKSQFSRRIEMLLHSRAEPTSVSWRAKTLIGALFALCGGSQLALAASAPQERAPAPRRAPEAELFAPPAAPEPIIPPLEWSVEPPTPPSVPTPFASPAPAPAPRSAPRFATPATPGMGGFTPGIPPSGSFALGQEPRARPGDSAADRLRRATELLERALERNPGDEDLRRAIELLHQARELGEHAFIPVPRFDRTPEPEIWRDAQRYAEEAERVSEHARRAALEAQKQQLDALREAAAGAPSMMRRFEERERSRNGIDDGPSAPDSRRSGIEAELEATRRLLEERRAELDALRARIEDLRTRERTLEVPPEPRERGAR